MALREQHQQRKVRSIHSPTAIYILQSEETPVHGEKERAQIKIERSTGKGEEISPQRKKSEVTDSITAIYRWHWHGREVGLGERWGREGGEELELAASCTEQTGKPSWTRQGERFLRLFLIHFCVSPFTKNPKSKNLMLTKRREQRRLRSTQAGR